LGHGECLHDPEGFGVWEVVEHEPGDGEGSEVFEASGAWEVLELAAVGEEGEGDDGLEVAAVGVHGGGGKECAGASEGDGAGVIGRVAEASEGFVLSAAEQVHVEESFVAVLDVAVEDGGV